jgi:hypothetical protein
MDQQALTGGRYYATTGCKAEDRNPKTVDQWSFSTLLMPANPHPLHHDVGQGHLTLKKNESFKVFAYNTYTTILSEEGYIQLVSSKYRSITEYIDPGVANLHSPQN